MEWILMNADETWVSARNFCQKFLPEISARNRFARNRFAGENLPEIDLPPHKNVVGFLTE